MTNAFCLALIDADHFKKVNDSYGHDVGDIVLKEIARTLQSQLRDTDLVCRFGGEEFVVLLRKLQLPQAVKRLEKLRQAIEALSLSSSSGFEIKVTISIGVTVYDHRLTDNIDPLLKKADEALYRAKELGRNRVEQA